MPNAETPITEQFYGLLREPKQARSKKLIADICSATIALAKEEGVPALNTNAIAQRAGIEATSLYRFFSGKEAILEYIYAFWLAEIRAIWDEFDTDLNYQELGWEEFFVEISEAWPQSDSTLDKYQIFQEALPSYTVLRAMDLQHRDYYVDFLARNFRRFGATGTVVQWRNLAEYLYVVEDEVHAKAAQGWFTSLEEGRALFLETMLFHIGKLMPTKHGL
jgi:AcrR family transcriptional regulator